MKLKIDKGFTSAFYTSLLCVAIYLLAASMPSFGLVDQNDFTGVLRYVALPFVVVLLYKDGYRLSKHSLTSVLLCLPLLLVCFGNLISIGLNSQATITWNTSSLSRDFVYTLGTAVTEEVVFRFGCVGERINLVEYQYLRLLRHRRLFLLARPARVGTAYLLNSLFYHLVLLFEVRVTDIHDVHQQVRLAHLVQRRFERLHQIVRQFPYKPYGV